MDFNELYDIDLKPFQHIYNVYKNIDIAYNNHIIMQDKLHLWNTILIFFVMNGMGYAQTPVPAFPGAEGFGTNTPGGRGGKVILVSNLNDSGEGSFRAAVNEEGSRIVLFTVGGLISLQSPIVVTNPYITIVGQTAPGDGICIRGSGIKIQTHDIVMRYIRVRPGDISFGKENNWGEIDAISIGSNEASDVYNIVLDHCSLSWGVDENLGIWGDAHDITIQYCIISEALNNSKHPKGPHSMGVLIGNKATNVSMHHNLFAHNSQRNPRVNGETSLDFRNNVIYNPGGTASDFGNEYQDIKFEHINYVGNYLIRGRNTQTYWEINYRKSKKPVTKIFLENNIGFNPYSHAQNKIQVLIRYNDGSLVDVDWRVEQPFSFPAVTTHTPEQALNIVLNDAGATFPLRDAVDRKVIRDVENRQGGLINTKHHFLEWPPFENGIAFLDSDGDGMPDHFEETYHLNPFSTDSNRDDNADYDGDGYTNVEEFFNGTDPTSSVEVKPLGTSNNFVQHTFPDIPFNLEQNFPNPFDTLTKIKFSIDSPAKIKLNILREDGKEVSTLVNAFLYEGKYEVALDATGLEPGLYIISISSGKHTKAVRAILK